MEVTPETYNECMTAKVTAEKEERHSAETSLPKSRTETNQRLEFVTLATESHEAKQLKSVIAASSTTSIDRDFPPVKPSALCKFEVFRAEEFAQLDSYAAEVGTTCQSLGNARSYPCRGAVA